MASLKSRIEKLESRITTLKNALTAVKNSYLPLRGGTISGNLTISGKLNTGLLKNNSARTCLNGFGSQGGHVVTVGGTSSSHNVMVFNKENETLDIKKYRFHADRVTAKSLSVSRTKNFVIDHPLDPENKELVHASLEGPEAGVYYRGTGQLIDGRIEIELPDYFEALVRKEGRTVMLTPICDGDNPVSMLAASEVRDGVFTVQEIDNKNCSQRFYWEVKAIRGDVPELVVNRKKQPAELAH